MNYKQQIGLHLRVKDTLSTMVQEALSYNLKVFQFFLTKQNSSHYPTLTAKDKEEFARAYKEHFEHVYIHSSYWINPSTGNKQTFAISKTLLKREIHMAKALGIEYLVLHAGSAKGHSAGADIELSKKQGILSAATMLNSVLKKETDIKILLENGAHGNKTVGSNIEDFALLKSELDYPEKVGFCVDTAHAFSYGYDLENSNSFVTLIDKYLGLENIKLLHFNDTKDSLGSMKDQHAFPGQGSIGRERLQAILNHPQLIGIPKIIEGPPSNHQAITELLHEVGGWQ